MEIKVTYAELERVIENKVGKHIGVKYVNQNTLKIDYTLQLLTFECQKSINLRVLGIEDGVINVDFMDEEVTDTVIGVLTHFVSIDFITVNRNNRLISIDTNQIEQMKEIYNHASLESVSFDMGGINLKINL